MAGDHDVHRLGRDRGGTPETAAATGLLNTVIAEQYFEQLMRWLEASPDEPAEWQQAAPLGDRILYVTAEELEELSGRVRELVDEYFERQVKPELRPPGCAPGHLAAPGLPERLPARKR